MFNIKSEIKFIIMLKSTRKGYYAKGIGLVSDINEIIRFGGDKGGTFLSFSACLFALSLWWWALKWMESPLESTAQGSEPCLHLKHQRPYSREGTAGLARAHRRDSGKGM